MTQNEASKRGANAAMPFCALNRLGTAFVALAQAITVKRPDKQTEDKTALTCVGAVF